MHRMNAFVELANRAVPDESFLEVFCRKYGLDKAVQEALNKQLDATALPYQDYRNRGCATNSANY